MNFFQQITDGNLINVKDHKKDLKWYHWMPPDKLNNEYILFYVIMHIIEIIFQNQF